MPDSKPFREIVGEAIGEASTCWLPRPTGVFDSTRASALVDRIERAAEQLPANDFGALGPQAFFAQLAESLRTPHASEPYREFVKALLLRAEEAKLYTPEAK